MQHMAKLIRHFQDNINEQWDYIQSIFIEMEQAGLHKLLNQDYKQIRGTIHRQQCVRFTPTTASNSPSPILQPPTPYPQSSPSSSPRLVALRYSPTASQYSPMASQYGTPPESPTFNLEILFPNLDFVPISNVEEVENCESIKRQIEDQMRTLNRIQVDWVNYQGGIGSRFNLIIIEDD